MPDNKWTHLILALVLTFLIISGSVILTLAFRPLYYRDINALKIVETSGYSKEEIRLNYDALIDYNMAWEKGLLEFPTLPQSKEAQIHFREVKDIFDLFKYIGIGTLVFGVAGVLFMKKKKEYLYLKYTGILAVALPAAVGTIVASNWQKAFVLFHEIAFDNDFWLFDPSTDPIIKMLPDTFFFHCAVMILLGVVAGSVICSVLYLRIKKKEMNHME